MKKRIWVLLSAIVVMTVFMAGCSKSESMADGETESMGYKEELIIGTAADIYQLDVQKQNDQINNIPIALTHETLVFFSNEGTFDPGLAASWEFTDDTHILFKLKEGITFHDGSPLTADDVKFTYDMGLENELSVLKGLEEVTVMDPLSVELRIDTFSNEFVQSLASFNLAILSKAAYDSGMDSPYLMGSGPYKYDNWVEGEYSTFVKNENYWGENKGVSERITFRPILEPSSRVIALQNGEIDVCIDPPVNELQYLMDDEDITVFERSGTRLFYFGFNTQKAPWDNKLLRQAVASAIDREYVMDVAIEGKGLLQTTILNRGLWGFNDEMEGFDYDVERAKELMAEAGYPDGGIETTILVSGAPYTDIAQVIQANLAEIGITVEVNNVDSATLQEIAVAGEHDLFLWRWNEDTKVDFVYRDLFYTDSFYNYHHYSDADADRLIDLVLIEEDPDTRMAYGIELQEYLVDSTAQVPLYIANLVIAYNKNLEGEYLFGGGNHNWKNAYIAE